MVCLLTKQELKYFKALPKALFLTLDEVADFIPWFQGFTIWDIFSQDKPFNANGMK